MSDVEETIVVPKRASEAMTKAATEFDMQSCITSKYPWRDYMSDLWAVMVANAPATPKPDGSPVCVEVKELEWQGALPLRRDAIAGGLHYSVRSLTGRVDGPWIAQVTTAVNPYQTADLLSPGPLLEMLKACQADHERRTLELINARSVADVRAEARAEYEAELREASTAWHKAARSNTGEG